MKLIYFLMASTLVLGACSKTDTPPGGSPIAVTLNPTTKTVNAGDSLSIACTITDQNNLKDVVISEVIGTGSSAQLQSYTISGKSYQFNYVYHVPAVTSGTQIVITFTVDDASNTQTATTTITVGTSVANDFSSYSAVLLGSYNDPSVGSFYGSSNNTVYTVNSASSNQSLIDMVFYFGATNQYTLAAPSDGSFGANSNQINLGIQNWGTRNATSFKTTSLSDFSSITKAADIAAAYSAGSNADTKATQLAAGSIIAFQTAHAKYGLCKIVDESNGNTSGQGQMHIQVVVQN